MGAVAFADSSTSTWKTRCSVLVPCVSAGSTVTAPPPGLPRARLGRLLCPAGTSRTIVAGKISSRRSASLTVTLRNRLGLHARPAASLARLMAGFDAVVVVDGVNATSVLELMTLGATGGRELEVRVSGPQRAEALAALVEAVEGGFGEV